MFPFAEYQHNCSFDDLNDQYCGITWPSDWGLFNDTYIGAYEGMWYRRAEFTARS